MGTMVGWKRIVVTVGEKIGKEHLTYGQGAAAELVAMGTIFAADNFGLPVSTTHVLSSGIAGTMAANKSGLQMSTIRDIALAWVFTLPAALGAIAFQNKSAVYDLLFRTAAQTLTTIAADPKHLGARIGLSAVLHTWGSALTHHPHVHVIVPGGGLSPDGSRWIACKPGFFLPVRVLSRLFRRLFLEGLAALHAAGRLVFLADLAPLADQRGFDAALAPLRRSEWVVYAKRPFAGPKAVLAYLARYTHRVAISNSRLIALDEKGVTFKWEIPWGGG